MTEPEKYAWNVDTPEGWVDAVIAWPWHKWEQDGADLGWRKWGDCPRCHDTMAVYQISAQAIRAITTVPARCNCRYPHDNRPPDADGGCGVGSGAPIQIPVAK